jgi:two-component system KDP operon response regulator KdpE
MSTDLEVAHPRILVVEDDPEIRRFLRASLVSSGYHLVESSTGEDGLTKVADERPALVLLDLGLPDIDGLTVIRRLRGWSNVPIIVLSARGGETDKIKALDSGADDYLTKPFSVGELMARIRVALRHVGEEPSDADANEFAVGDLRIDFRQRQVLVCGKEVRLTPIEYRILTILARHAGQLITHRQLLKEVWGPDRVLDKHYLRVYITYLRRKIEPEPARPRYVLTEPGIGYRLAV